MNTIRTILNWSNHSTAETYGQHLDDTRKTVGFRTFLNLRRKP